MGACVEVECPKCHQSFVVSPTLLGSEYKLHCPFCDHTFRDTESPRVWGQPPAGYGAHRG